MVAQRFPDVMANKMRSPRMMEMFYGHASRRRSLHLSELPELGPRRAYGFPSIERRGFKVALAGTQQLVQRHPALENRVLGKPTDAALEPIFKLKPETFS